MTPQKISSFAAYLVGSSVDSIFRFYTFIINTHILENPVY